MSVLALRWAAEQSAGGPMPKLVLYALAEHANRDGYATTSVTTLARTTEASRATVKRALVQLAERGLITWARRQRGTGADTSNAYRLTLDSPHATMPGEVAMSPAPVGLGEPGEGHSEPRPGSQGHPRWLTPSPHAGVSVSPQGEPELLNRTTEPKSSVARTRARGAGTTTVADLAATAVRPDAYRLVSAWREQTGAGYRPATLRELAKHADTLLRDGGDPTAIRAALDEWNRRPHARPGLLPYLYDDAVKALRSAGRTAASGLSTRDAKAAGWFALAAELAAEDADTTSTTVAAGVLTFDGGHA